MIIPINPDSIGDPNQTPVVYIGDAGEVLGIQDRSVQHPTGQVDLDEVRRLARAATPGPWRYNPEKAWHLPTDLPLRRNGEEFVGAGPVDAMICIAATGPADHPQSVADARYIAAADPATVLALLADLDAAREALRRAEQGRDYWRSEATQAHEYWTDLGNEVLKYAPEDYDDDCAADAIAIRYVRDLETAWGSVRQLAQRWIDEGTTDDADAPAAAVFRATGLRQVEGAAVDTYETQEGTDAS